MSESGPPAGWYPDPEDSRNTRYWDGVDWTEQRAPAPPPAVPGSPAPPLAAPPTAAPQPVALTPQKTNGMAIASLVLGILWIWWVGSVLALIFGYVGKRQIDDSRGTQGGRGMAVAGIVLGWVGVGALVIVILALAGSSGN